MLVSVFVSCLRNALSCALFLVLVLDECFHLLSVALAACCFSFWFFEGVSFDVHLTQFEAWFSLNRDSSPIIGDPIGDHHFHFKIFIQFYRFQ